MYIVYRIVYLLAYYNNAFNVKTKSHVKFFSSCTPADCHFKCRLYLRLEYVFLFLSITYEFPVFLVPMKLCKMIDILVDTYSKEKCLYNNKLSFYHNKHVWQFVWRTCIVHFCSMCSNDLTRWHPNQHFKKLYCHIFQLCMQKMSSYKTCFRDLAGDLYN